MNIILKRNGSGKINVLTLTLAIDKQEIHLLADTVFYIKYSETLTLVGTSFTKTLTQAKEK